MANKARIVNGQAVDVTPAEDVATRFHPDVAAQFVDVPDGVENGWLQADDGTWSAPPPPPAPPPAPIPQSAYEWGPIDWLNTRWLPQERVAARKVGETDLLVADFIRTLDDGRTLQVVTNNPGVAAAIEYLTTLAVPEGVPPMPDGRAKILTADRAAAILAPRA